MKPAGHELCFTMSVVDEHELVADRVARIKRVYPDARIALLVDAPPGRPAEDGWPGGAGIKTIHTGLHLYSVQNGGRVVQEHLMAFLATDARWWLQVDPDTIVRRPFEALPDERCFFGTLQGGEPGPSLQGGCIGGPRTTVVELALSGVLLDPALVDYERTWARGNPNLLARAREGAGLVSFDFVHAWACRKLDIPLLPHPEIRSEWKQPPADGERFAVTHPHKHVDEEAERREAADRRAVAGRVVELVEASVPDGAQVAVVSKGDEELVALYRRTARHFPGDGRGGWAGFHPADSQQAIDFLESERAAGSDHLVIPETALWWLDHYAGLRAHLDAHYRLVARTEGAGAIWALREGA